MQLCLLGMLLAQQTFIHECSTIFFSLPRSLTSAPQETRTSLSPDSQLSSCSAAAILGTHVEHTVVDSLAQVFGLVVLCLHMRNSHGSSVLVCSGLEGWCWA